MNKLKMFFVVALVVAWLAGCATEDRTMKLRVGMTRDEAVRAMGAPDSVSAISGVEYLNYVVPDRAGPYGSRPYVVRLVDGIVDSYGYAGQLDRGLPSAAARNAANLMRSDASPTSDGLKILSVEPAALVPGRSQTVTVRLKYSLRSLAQADIDLTFNDRTASAFSQRQSQLVPNGVGEVTLTATVVPVNWGEMNDFKVAAHLIETPRHTGTRALANDQRVIALKP